MERRFSRQEKEKWIPGTSKHGRRSPVRMPPSDNSTLIAENWLSLIGRVTNPEVQKPRWVVDWLIQFWNMESTVTRRALVPELFQFRFESEEALETVLRKGPYHYKRWMLILQRWEPIVSNSFPALIHFWTKIHGIPLHYWTAQIIRTIGKKLGFIPAQDIPGGRILIHINGLCPLEMTMPIRLPKGEVIWVELEYEKLEKHCFKCCSLFYEKKDCPIKRE